MLLEFPHRLPELPRQRLLLCTHVNALSWRSPRRPPTQRHAGGTGQLGTNGHPAFPWREDRAQRRNEEPGTSLTREQQKGKWTPGWQSSTSTPLGRLPSTQSLRGRHGLLVLTLNWASGGPVMMTILSLTSGPSAGAICSLRKGTC